MSLPQSEIDAFLLGEITSIRSSMIRTAQWDADEQLLTLEFQAGDRWSYSPVPEARASEFAKAASHGKWLHAHKKSFQARRHG
jgi:hypothetical protein